MTMLYYESSFAHHGVKGQKWGVKRYQNSDGSLTAAGRIRYGLISARYQNKDGSLNKRGVKKRDKEINKTLRREKAEQQRLNIERQKIAAAQKTADERAKLEEAKNKLKETSKNNDEISKPKSTEVKTDSRIKSTPKDVKSLSDSELRAMVNDLRSRRQLETDYKNLTASKSDKFVDWAKTTALEIGKNTVKQAVTDVATQQLKKYLNGIIDTHEAKRIAEAAKTLGGNQQNQKKKNT